MPSKITRTTSSACPQSRKLKSSHIPALVVRESASSGPLRGRVVGAVAGLDARVP